MSAAKSSAEERNEKVRAVLRDALSPLGPTEIARRINEDWCVFPGIDRGYPQSAKITPICRRIGAIGVKGKYTLPKEPA